MRSCCSFNLLQDQNVVDRDGHVPVYAEIELIIELIDLWMRLRLFRERDRPAEYGIQIIAVFVRNVALLGNACGICPVLSDVSRADRFIVVGAVICKEQIQHRIGRHGSDRLIFEFHDIGCARLERKILGIGKSRGEIVILIFRALIMRVERVLAAAIGKGRLQPRLSESH